MYPPTLHLLIQIPLTTYYMSGLDLMLGKLEDNVEMVAESDAGDAKLSKMNMIPAIMYLKGERGICI